MPGGDGTGPSGMGPMTGRAAGYCAGYPAPGFMNLYGGRLGSGFGWGRGRGWGAYPGGTFYGAPPYGTIPYGAFYTQKQELDILQNQAKVLENQLTEIQKRISELGDETSKKSK